MTDLSKTDMGTAEQVESRPGLGSAPQWIRDISPEELSNREKRLKRKIDFRLLPMVVIMYILNYLDRNNIATARLAGLEEDLHLVGNQYQTSVSILFVGYLLMQVPSNMLLNKMGKPSLYLPGCMVVWGIISGSTAATKSFGGLLACRFILGFVEAAYFPGALYFLSCWYTRKELALRTAFLYSGSLVSGAFGGLIAAGIVEGMGGLAGLSAWQWLFLLEGILTVVVASIAVFIIPDVPRTTRWLSEEEKQLAAWRLQADIGEDDWVDSQHQSPVHGLKLAFTDPKTWLLLLVIYGSTASGSMTTFFPTVVETLGYGKIQTLLLTAPPYIVAVIVCLYASVTNTTQDIIAVATTAIAQFLPRPATKRTAALALINALSNVCQVYSPYLYPTSAAPRYVNAFVVNIAMSAMTVIAMTVLRIYLGRLNKKLDRGETVRDVGNNAGAAGSPEANGFPEVTTERGFRFLL
ncbi:MFS general substrate transporter [Diaporthe amygdali]|uniref:MFS general substrate transporter n=1 Tax=Phomopsis amygdali TaxID=1214568 RepID=UPI0022FEF1DF|nr:MFS general substrate transporter [Diaporthe amygdali]KAJ0119630.1 MFS general substrate transporter [Diaporthe amygdali]